MKRLNLFLLSMAMALLSFSQELHSLKPRVYIDGADTILGFSIHQSKFIAISIASGAYCDSIAGIQKKEISSLNELNILSNQKIHILKEVNSNLKNIVSNNEIMFEGLRSDIEVYKKKINTQRLIGGSAILLLLTMLIIK